MHKNNNQFKYYLILTLLVLLFATFSFANFAFACIKLPPYITINSSINKDVSSQALYNEVCLNSSCTFLVKESRIYSSGIDNIYGNIGYIVGYNNATGDAEIHFSIIPLLANFTRL
jgi:hypothetical protein